MTSSPCVQKAECPQPRAWPTLPEVSVVAAVLGEPPGEAMTDHPADHPAVEL